MNSKAELLNILDSFAHALKAHPRTIFWFTCYKLWIFLIFTKAFEQFNSLDFSLFKIPQSILIMIGMAVFFIFVAIFMKRFNMLVLRREWLAVVAFMMSLGTLFMFIWSKSASFGLEATVICAMLSILFISIGTGSLHIEAGRMMGYLGMKRTLIYGQIALLFSALLYLVCQLLPLEIVWFIIAILPIIAGIFLHQDKHEKSYEKINNEESAARKRLPLRLLMTSFLQGLAFGFIIAILFFGGIPADLNSFGLESLGILLAVFITFMITLFLKLDMNRLIYQIGFFMVCAGLLLFGISGKMLSFAAVLQISGFYYLDLVLWALGSYFIKNRNQSATWMSSVIPSALSFGRILGLIFGSLVIQFAPLQSDFQMIIILVAFIILFACLCLSNNSNVKYGWGLIRPGDEQTFEAREQTCYVIRDEKSLSDRETEILIMLSSGLDRMTIAEQLFVSPNTVKVHIRNIYGKLDIHSHRDLLLMIQNQEKAFATAEEAIIIPFDE